MNIHGVSNNSFTPISIQNNSDNEIRMLEKQKSKIQEQIDKIREGDAPEKIKQDLIKSLKEQIENIDTQIQQKQMEKAQKNTDKHNEDNTSSKQTSSQPLINPANNSDTASLDNLTEAVVHMSKIRTISGIGSSLKGTSRVLRQEAKLDRDRDETGNGLNIAAKKEKKAAELEKRASNINIEASKESKKIRKALNKNTKDVKANEKAGEENEESVDNNSNVEKKQLEDYTKREQNQSIDTFA